jgi:phosphomevalonate kinase
MAQPGLKQNEGLDREAEKPIQISSLLNSIYYFIEMVFIMTVKDGYRLIAIQQKKLLTDKIYKTAGGARAAFLRRYEKNAWRADVTADWSHFYTPITGWCDKTLRGKKPIGK